MSPSVAPKSPTPGAGGGSGGRPVPRIGGPNAGAPYLEAGNGVRIGDHGGSPDLGWGSLQRPKALAWDWENGATVRARLGFSGRPQSDFWRLEFSEETLVTAVRRSDDPAAIHLAVGLVSPDGRHLGSLVTSPGGTGPQVRCGPGPVVLVAAMGLAAEIEATIALSFLPVLGQASGTARIEVKMQSGQRAAG